MPFVEQKNRKKIALLGCEACQDVGDICYVFYSSMMDKWKEQPRWRTIHKIYKEMVLQPEANEYVNYVYDRLQHKFGLDDIVCAVGLAWQVFFNLHAMPYELKKIEENGDIR